MGRHEAPPRATVRDIVADYITERAIDLIAEFDRSLDCPPDVTPFDPGKWCGAAAEVLRELTRDA